MKKIVLCMMAILLVVGMAYTTYASEGNIMDQINDMLQNETGNVTKNEATEDIPEGTKNNTALNVNTTTDTNTNVNTNENLPASTPYTGIGDYSGLIFVAVFGISAIYAYKKVKEYNA